MEYRKLISFGKSSYVVSLPKAWINQNKLKKGALIYFEESGPNMILSVKEGSDQKEKKSKVIDIDGKSSHWIGREVCTAYITNTHEITLKGKQIKNKIKELQGVIQNLIALEVMEQTSETMVSKDFLDMDTVSVTELVRKMDLVTRTMMKESLSVFKERNFESINDRDKDVNRLYFLLYRSLIYNLENPSKAMKNLKMTTKELLRNFFVGFYIEFIADEVRRTVRSIKLLKNNEKIQKEINTLMENLEQYYLDTVKCYYKEDQEKALPLSDLKMGYDQDLDKIEKNVMKVEELNKVVNHLSRLIGGIHNLGRVLYTL